MNPPFLYRAQILVGGSNQTRDPTPDEATAIDTFVDGWVLRRGGVPMLDHVVPGVDDPVVFWPPKRNSPSA